MGGGLVCDLAVDEQQPSVPGSHLQREGCQEATVVGGQAAHEAAFAERDQRGSVVHASVVGEHGGDGSEDLASVDVGSSV